MTGGKHQRTRHGDGRKNGHRYARPDAVQVHADGNLHQGKRIKESGRNEADLRGVQRKFTDQLRGDHRNGSPVKLGKHEQQAGDQKDEPAFKVIGYHCGSLHLK